MKNKIMGFSQSKILKLKGEIDGWSFHIEVTDLLILKWLVKHHPNMPKKISNTECWVDYVYIDYDKILADLPILGLDKHSLAKIFAKLVCFGILECTFIKGVGSEPLYIFGDKYFNLVSKGDK